MIVLSVHNSYQQPGGEDEVFRQEASLLEQHGHEVIRFESHNADVARTGRLELLTKTVFNIDAYYKIQALLRKAKPDIMHVHNTFPLISPGIYYAASREGVPVVQTLHNYRMLCPAGTLYRDGNVCESCMKTNSLWPAVRHACYRGSRSASAATAVMLTAHRLLKTFDKHITTYIALSEFSRSKFIEGGLPSDRLIVKPNFLSPDPGFGNGSPEYYMFVGRLTHEKGVLTLLDAWTRLAPTVKLVIAGDGPLAAEVAATSEKSQQIKWLGQLDKVVLHQTLRQARALIVPSTWYEPFGVVVAEAFAMGVPVIASRIGALGSLVEHGRTGLLFSAGSSADLAAQITWLEHEPEAWREMSREARLEFETNFTDKQNYEQLITIYRSTIDRHRSGQPLKKAAVADNRLDSKDLVQIAKERL